MRVDGSAEVFRAAAEFHHGDAFRHQIRGDVRHDVRAEDAVRLRVGNKLHETHRVIRGESATIGGERKFADTHFHAFFFREIFRDAGPRDFRVGVDDSRNDVVVHVSRFAGDHLDASDAFLLCFVGQHGPGDDVADSINAFDVGAETSVDFDPLPVVEFDAKFIRADAFDEGATADGDEHFVGFEGELFVALGRFRGGFVV